MPSTTKRKTNDPVLRFIDSFRASINSGSLWSIYCDRIRLPFYHPSVFETDLVTCDFFGVPIAALHHYYANVLPGFRIMGQKTRIKRISIMIALSLTPSGECETEGQCDHEKPTDSSFAFTHYWQTSFLIKPAAEVQVQRSTSPELGGIARDEIVGRFLFRPCQGSTIFAHVDPGPTLLRRLALAVIFRTLGAVRRPDDW